MININIEMTWASKLIDVISKGVGTLSAKFVAKQISKGKKHEIKEIAEGIAEANKLPVKVSYEDGKISVEPKNKTIEPANLSEYRAAEYMIRRESLKLFSAEKASLFAAEELEKRAEEKEKISNKKIDDNWISKFFDEVGNVKEEKALKYWGKLLAGEIQQPGTYSIRTLNLLGNIGSHEAELISRALNHAILVVFPKIENFKPRNNFGFICHEIKPATYDKNILTHYESEILASLGVIASSGSSVSWLKRDKKENSFYYGDYGIKVSRNNNFNNKDSDIRSGKVKLLTHLGLELLDLHELETNKEYLESVASTIHRKNLNVSLIDGVHVNNKMVRFKKVIKELRHH